MKPIFYIIIGTALGFFASKVSSNTASDFQSQNEISASPNLNSAESRFMSALTNEISEEGNEPLFLPDQNSLNTGSRKISAVEARAMRIDYEKSTLQKLKAVSDEGKIVDLESIIIDKSIIESLIEAIEKEPKKSRREFLGIALTPAIKKVSVDNVDRDVHTFIVTALASELVGKEAPHSNGSSHYLPKDENEKTLIYDYIDLCPSNCPTNQPQIENRKWTAN